MYGFCKGTLKPKLMSKGTTLLLAFILIFTFPIWIGLLAGGFGLIMGIFGGILGIIGGIFGAIFGVIGSVFGAIFGIFDWSWGHSHTFFPHVHFNGYAMAAIVIVAILILNKRKERSN